MRYPATRSFRALLTLAAILLLSVPASSQDQSGETNAPPTPPPGLVSPRETMFTFIEAASEPDWPRAASALDLPPGTEAGAQTVSSRLLGVINRIGEVRPSHLPSQTSAAQQDLESFVFFPQTTIADHRRAQQEGIEGTITLTRGDDGAWRFSRETIDDIDNLYDSAASLDIITGVDEADLDYSIRIQRMMPEQLQGRAIGLYYWQWLGLLLLIFLGVIIDYIVQAILRTTAARRLRKRGAEFDSESLKRTMRPYGLFAASLFLIASIWLLALPVEALRVVIPAIRLIMSVATVWAAFRTVDLIASVAANRAKLTSSRYDDLLIPLIRKTLK
ncbi:MAG: hypothetical protein ACYTF7_11140, partial [Planctomycetota bacterium]